MKKYITIAITILIGIILIYSPKVKAATTYSWTTKQSRVYIDQQGTETQTSWQTIPYTQSVSYPVTQMQYRLKYSGGLTAGNTYKFKISYLPNPDAINVSGIWFSDGTETLTEVNCSGWARESNNYYANICAISPTSDISADNYLYVRIVFNESYLTSIRSYVGDFEETKGTGAIIQDSAIDIMNNQNENTQAIINANKVCETIDKSNIEQDNKYLAITGSVNNNSTMGITKYYKINTETDLEMLTKQTDYLAYYCFYNTNKTLIGQCYASREQNVGKLNIPNDSEYVRFTIVKDTNKPTFKICKQGNQALQDTLDQDAEYDTEGEEIEGQEDINNYEQAESDLMESLDFSAVDDLDITINADTSSFIWQIVERLRQISSKIVLLFTSVLGLGLIKMILNR